MTPHAAAPLDSAVFARLMAAFAPYESRPRLAVAVSGGADSMALAWLACRWAAERDGQAIALVVDHGLRPGSASEAAGVADRCRGLGLEATVLNCPGPSPGTGIEAAARVARYRLLEETCRNRGCLHLLTAHHADDQAETVAMRRDMASGPLGLAGMSACIERAGLRLLRPLLAVTKARLLATVAAQGLDWVDDPMNHDMRFARTRLRAGAIPTLPGVPDRTAFETRLTAALVRTVTLDSWGVARVDCAAWNDLDRDLAVAAIGRVALAVGGGAYPPSPRQCGAVARDLADRATGAFTLGNCLWRLRRRFATVVREARNLPSVRPLVPGQELTWDGRFLVSTTLPGLSVAPLGAAAWRAWRAEAPPCRERDLPPLAAATLPAILDLEGVCYVPHLRMARRAMDGAVSVRFAPRHGLAPAPFVAGQDRPAWAETGRGVSATA